MNDTQTQSKRILITNFESLHTPGGPATFVVKLIAGLRSAQTVTYRNDCGASLHPREINLGAKTFCNEILWISCRGWTTLLQKIAQADLVHVNLFNFTELILSFIMKMKGLKIVWTLHSHIILRQKSPKIFLEHFRLFLVFNSLLPFTDRAIFLTESHRDNYRRHTFFRRTLAAKSRIIPHAIESKRILSKRIAPASPPAVIYAGRFERQKGFHDLLRLVKNMENEDVHFTLVGGTPPLGSGKIQNNIRFFPPMPNDSLFPLYDEANILILPSHSESFGIVILEAMARGLVILLSDIPGMREIVREGRNGYFFPPGDVQCMRRLILDLKNHPGDLNRISENNLEDIRHFSTAVQVKRYLDMYHEALAGNH